MAITTEEGLTDRDLQRIRNSEYARPENRRPEARIWVEDFDSYMCAADTCGAADQSVRVVEVD